jgi:hypothetical protein
VELGRKNGDGMRKSWVKSWEKSWVFFENNMGYAGIED